MMDKLSIRPRLLFICKFDPWRLNNGAIIRNYWLITALAERFDVDVITADDATNPIAIDFQERCAQIRRFPRPQGVRAKVVRVAGALRPGGTFFTSGSVTREMRAETARLVATRGYSAIMTDLGMIDAVPMKTTVPIVYSGHNSEATLMLRRAELEPIWSRIAMTIDALRLRRLEADLVKRSVIVTACSQNDVDDMVAFVPSITQKAVVIPNGVDCKTYADVARTAGEDGTILVPGSFDWLPNRRGLMWFVNEVLPLLERQLAGKEFRVRVAGRMDSSFAKKLGDMSPRLTVVPNVPRMEAELQAASIVAVPVIASSGTRLRILEAWAAGRAIVTTEHGAFGLNYTNGIDLFACSEPQQFASAAAKLFGDRALRDRLRAAGAERAAAYDWSAIGTKLLMSFEQCGLLPVVRREPIIGVES